MKKSKYFQTSDGEQFYNESDAKNHAKTLDNKTVTPPQDKEIEVSGATAESGKPSDENNSPAAKTKVIKPVLTEPFTLAAFDANAENAYEAGKFLVKELKLTTKSNKKADVFATLEAEKAKPSVDNQSGDAAASADENK